MNNKGFSLIELIVTITIMVVTIGVITFSISIVYANNVKVATTAVSSLISQCKIDKMSHAGDTYIRFMIDKNNIVAQYYVEGALQETEVIGSNRIDFTYSINTDSTREINLQTSPLIISFDRTTGAFLDMKNAHKLGGGSSLTYTEDEFCAEIKLSTGTQVYTIDLAPSTGSHKIV